MSEGDFLSRWSRRKIAARRGEVPAEPVAPAGVPTTAASAPAPVQAVPQAPIVEAAPALPPVETLTPESDFAPFMQPNVEGSVRRAALKTLFQDPRFNVMDGLDVYIDDYSKPDPLPEGWLEKMNQVAHLGDYQPPPEPGDAPQAIASPAPEAPASTVDPQAEIAPPQDSGKVASEPHSRS